MATQGWPDHTLERLHKCPVCHSAERTMLYDALTDRVFRAAPGTWQLHRCRGCGVAYLNPRPHLEAIDRAYAGYYTHREPAFPWVLRAPQIPAGRIRFALRNGYLNRRFGYALQPACGIGHILGYLRPVARAALDQQMRHLRLESHHPQLLDVGCGNGAFLWQMAELGWRVQGLEPDASAASTAAKIVPSVQVGTLLDSTLPDEYFDAITLSHVLEHFHDPAANLAACHRALRPGGLLWIATPNLSGLGHARFQSHWRGLEPPRHLVLFTPGSLRALLEATGFTIVSQPAVLRSAWFYRASAAMEKGLDPLAPPPLSRDLRAEALLADLRAWARPGLSEELVLIARRSSNTMETGGQASASDGR